VLVPKVDFISAPGWSPPDVWRRGGPQALVTGKAIFAWQKDRKRFRLESVHPGGTAGEVRDNTGFDYDDRDCSAVTAAPADEDLKLLRGPVAARIAGNYPAFAQRVWNI
jgi:glutaconate CoA-transferase subunit B